MNAPDKLLRHPDAFRLPDAAGRDFFTRQTETVARELLGAWFVNKVRGRRYLARIVETEAYLGPEDPACHTAKGRSERNAPMWRGGGFLYVYMIYGMHHCANIVTREAGAGEAVLIRAAALLDDPASRLLSGPGKFSAAFTLTREQSGMDLVEHAQFAIHPDPVSKREIAAAPRIGVDYAGDAAQWPLRFFIAGHPAVSKPMAKKTG